MESYVSSTAYMFKAILAGVVVALLASLAAIQLANRLRLVDVPGSAPHKQHRFPTPLAGGIALALTLPLLILATGLWRTPEILATLLCAAIIFVFGLVDDLRGMSAPLKFGGQLLAVILLILAGISIRIFTYRGFFIGGSGEIYVWMNYILTVLWVVGVTNAFNLVDSMDGLAVGLSSWAFAFFMLATYDSQQPALSLFSALLLGVCIGLNFLNSFPARMFLGDAGAQTLGFLLAVVAILYTPQAAYQRSSWFVPILLVGVPIFDTTLVFFSRLRRAKPFYRSNRDHTYHRLVALGLGPERAVIAMHLTALVLECLAFIAVSLSPPYANGIFAACLLAGVFCIAYLDNRKRWP